MSASNEKSRLNDSKRHLNENVKDNIAKIETKSSKYYETSSGDARQPK